MKKHKFSSLTIVILITLFCYGFIIKPKNTSVQVSKNATSVSVYQKTDVLIAYQHGITEAEKDSQRNCVAITLGTSVLYTKQCSSNPNQEIVTLARLINFPTNGSSALPDEDENQEQGFFNPHEQGFFNHNRPIFLTSDDILQITAKCGIILLTDQYNCNDFEDFKFAF